jgi:dihydroorotate dehydrogenase
MPGARRVTFDLYALVGPLLRCLPPEGAHRAAICALRLGLVPGDPAPDDPILACRVWGRDLANPLGLAAGFDKDAEVVDAALRLGFGFVEAGTVTPLPQPGNPRPRLFRLAEDAAVINRLGFNSKGLARFAGRLARHRRGPMARGLVGANVGRNKETPDPVADFELGVEAVAALADYVVMNLSSPNTPGLRALQARDALANLLERAMVARRRGAADPARPPPLVVKIAPDLSADERRDVAEVALAAKVDALIVGNTTVARPATLRSRDRAEPGGLSGRPLFGPATDCLAEMHRLTEGRIPLIGCGGVSSGADAYAKILAGATLVQLYTALVFEGPALVARIKRELAACLRRDGFAAVGDAVGRARR